MIRSSRLKVCRAGDIIHTSLVPNKIRVWLRFANLPSPSKMERFKSSKAYEAKHCEMSKSNANSVNEVRPLTQQYVIWIWTPSNFFLGAVFHPRWLPLLYAVVNQTKISHKSQVHSLSNLAHWQCLRACYLDLLSRSSGVLQAGVKASSAISGKREASRPSFLFRWALCWKHSSNLG